MVRRRLVMVGNGRGGDARVLVEDVFFLGFVADVVNDQRGAVIAAVIVAGRMKEIRNVQ